MTQQFEKLVDCLNFIEQMKGFGIEPSPELLAEKARLEELENLNPDEYIFSKMKLYNKFMTPQKEQVVREMTDQLMSEADNATQPCLLLGKVQCGKTDTFLSIMSLCFDRGIDIAVVFQKPTNTLTDQTIKRLNDVEKGFGRFKDQQTYNQKVVISIWDILDLGKRGGLSECQLNDPAYKFILVVKKEDDNLMNLIELFRKSELMRSKKVLVCDDEADFASRNYYKRKGEIGLMKIAGFIEEFIKLPRYCRYLQITATPYSLYLQPDGSIQLRDGDEASPWLPRYTGLVPIHDKYVGGKQYYELSEEGTVDEEGYFHPSNMYGYLFEPVSEDCMAVLSARNEWFRESNVHSGVLNDFNYAVVSYIFATAVRSIQVKNKLNKKYKSSCLIHCEIAKTNHRWQEDLITDIILAIKDAFLNQANSDLHILDLERDAYDSLKQSNELGNKFELIHEKFPTFGEVEAEVKRILENGDYIVKVVNSENPVSTMLDKESGQLKLEQALNFFIGGSILDRGITIDKMLCFFYGRNPGKFQMDTVLQHARMYGARDKEDMACTRFFTTEKIYDVLKSINEIDTMMYDYLMAHRDTVQTNDFVSMVIGYDPRVNASAANKYTPSNTKVLKPYMRILPKGFQTGKEEAIGNTIQEIDRILDNYEPYKNLPDGEQFFLLDYETAVKLILKINSTFVYAAEYNNVEYEWDVTEMITALDRATFDTDGYIYCQVCKDREMSRERENIYDKRGRFIDSPEGGATNKLAKMTAKDRPVLTLLRQNGSAAKGWMGTPFYWPSLMLHDELNPGIFTINSNKKFRAPKAQVHMEALGNYPEEQLLHMTIINEYMFNILLGDKVEETRVIKKTTASLYLAKDLFGNYIKVEGTDPDKYYSLSSYNNGVFPFELRDIKYIHFRNSQDLSGSQFIVELDDECPFELVAKKGRQSDILFNARNEGAKILDDDICEWNVVFYIKTIHETVLTPKDAAHLETLRLEKGNR